MTEFIKIIAAVASLAWGVWTYKRSRAQVRVTCSPCVLESGPGMTFRRPRSKKRIPVKPGSLSQPLLEIHARNLGPTTVAIEKMSVKLRGQWRDSPNVALENCWILVEDEHRVPAVLAPGAFWRGTCDFAWLHFKLQQLYGNRPVWDLVVTLTDAANGRQYVGETQVSTAIYEQIARRMRNRRSSKDGDEESWLDA